MRQHNDQGPGANRGQSPADGHQDQDQKQDQESASNQNDWGAGRRDDRTGDAGADGSHGDGSARANGDRGKDLDQDVDNYGGRPVGQPTGGNSR